jgi:hypothetical protein
MLLRDRLLENLKAAMRAGDKTRVSTLRFLRSAVGYAEVEKQHPLSDAEVLDVIAQQVKQHKDSIEQFQQGNRPDLVAEEQAQLVILQEYLPQQATRDEIIAAAKEAIAEVGATDPKQMGRVMQVLVPRLKGKAEGSVISQVVRDLLKATPKAG